MGFLQRPSLPTTAPLRGDPDSPGASTLRTQARALGLGVREDAKDHTELAEAGASRWQPPCRLPQPNSRAPEPGSARRSQ